MGTHSWRKKTKIQEITLSSNLVSYSLGLIENKLMPLVGNVMRRDIIMMRADGMPIQEIGELS